MAVLSRFPAICGLILLLILASVSAEFGHFESQATSSAPSDINQAIQRVLFQLENVDQKLKYFQSRSSSAHLLDIHELFLAYSTGGSQLKQGPLTITNVSEACSTQLTNLFKALYAKEFWAFKLVDSFGKPPSGVLQGSLNWVGEYVECVNISVPSLHWQSKHCVISKLNKTKNIDPNNLQIALKYGVCMPANCSSSDVAGVVNFLIELRFSKYGLRIEPQDVLCSEPKIGLDARAIIAIVIISVIVVTVLSASVVDFICLYRKNARLDSESRNLLIQIDDDTITANPPDSPQVAINGGTVPNPTGDGHGQTAVGIASISSSTTTWSISANPGGGQTATSFLERFISAISIFRNTAKIFKTSPDTSSSAGQGYQSFSQTYSERYTIDTLHAVRFLSMAWIILGHSIGYGLAFSDNLIMLLDWAKWFSFSVIINGFFSVDSFFVLSGALSCFSFMKELDKPNSKITCSTVFKYYAHRFWRLTPAYMLVLMFNATLTQYLGSGPFYPANGFEVNQCRDTWWTNLLYINNFVHPDKMCFSMGWYLANDMQFHWVALLILVPLGMGRFFLAILVSALFLIGNILSISLTLNSRPGSELGIFGTEATFFSEWVYFKPWTRIGPFVIGIGLGYLLFLNKKRATIPTSSGRPVTKAISWTVAVLFTSLCVFGLYPDFINFPEVKLSRATHIIYQTFSRLTWSVGLAIIIYSCETSTKNLIARVLKLKFWAPLSRLTYSAFLIQTVVIIYYYSTQEHPLKLQLQTIFYNYLGNLAMSYAAAYLVSVFFEMPFIALERVLFKKKSH